MGGVEKYANDKGISIIGDIPIYVALDSADTWAHPELFQFDENGLPTAVAGCPPDAFSATGQLWGNPLYRWDVHKNQGYSWWISRIKTCYELYDMLRIDHFEALMNIMRFRMEMQPQNLVSGKKVRALSCLRLWRIKWENFRFLLRIWDF